MLTSHPRSAARKAHAEKPHSSIQVVPITRPSLRDGRTAYAVLSREPSFPSGLPRPAKLPMPPPVDGCRIPQQLDRSNDGQDHTVLPYARPAISPQFSQPCRRSRKLTDETKPSSAARPHEASGSQRAIRPARTVSRPTLPRPPHARLAKMTTTRSPLKDEPEWATYTPFPNFGKVEYFSNDGIDSPAGVLPVGRYAPSSLSTAARFFFVTKSKLLYFNELSEEYCICPSR